MSRLPKMGRLALITSLLGGAAIAPVALSGQASAQAGSRICGRMWEIREEGNHGGEFIFKVYEVDKNYDAYVCASARAGGGSDADPTLGPDLVKKNLAYMRDGLALRKWVETEINHDTCEEFTKWMKWSGDIEFKDDGTPWTNPNQDDICNTMNKSENITQMKAYWLIWNKNTGYRQWAVHG